MCVKCYIAKGDSRIIKKAGAKNSNEKIHRNVYLVGGRGNDDTVHFETSCSLTGFLL